MKTKKNRWFSALQGLQMEVFTGIDFYVKMTTKIGNKHLNLCVFILKQVEEAGYDMEDCY